MDGVIRKSRQREPPAGELNLDLIRGRKFPHALEYFASLFFRQHLAVGTCLARLGISVENQLPLNALPTLTPRNLAGDAPWPVPITCWGCPFPQFGVPHNVHSSLEQTASIAFQNSVVIPEYEGFFSIRTRFPFLISHPISVPN